MPVCASQLELLEDPHIVRNQPVDILRTVQPSSCFQLLMDLKRAHELLSKQLPTVRDSPADHTYHAHPVPARTANASTKLYVTSACMSADAEQDVVQCPVLVSFCLCKHPGKSQTYRE